MAKVSFHEIGKTKGQKLIYVVICAEYQGEWVIVRHRARSTWEIPGGHIEKGEAADNAALRELKEETGAQEVKLAPVCDYSVEKNGVPSFGRLYYASITKLGELPDSEIAECKHVPDLPRNLTYPEIQPLLHAKVAGWLSKARPQIKMVAEM